MFRIHASLQHKLQGVEEVNECTGSLGACKEDGGTGLADGKGSTGSVDEGSPDFGLCMTRRSPAGVGFLVCRV